MLNVCHIVRAHQLNPKNRLAIYDEEEGQKALYDQLPAHLFHNWREIVLRNGCNPPLAGFIEFIEYQARLISSLDYRGSGYGGD